MIISVVAIDMATSHVQEHDDYLDEIMLDDGVRTAGPDRQYTYLSFML